MDLRDIIYNQRQSLASAGYTDKEMQYKGLAARFMRSFTLALEKAHSTSRLVQGKKEFQISLFGLVGPERDMVDYKFHFLFNPSETSLSLERITARLGDTRLVFLLSEKDPLPTSKEIHSALLFARNELPVQENKEDRLRAQIIDFSAVLLKKGYDGCFMTNSDYADRLVDSLQRFFEAYHRGEEPRCSPLYLSTYIEWNGDDEERVFCLFGVHYDTKKGFNVDNLHIERRSPYGGVIRRKDITVEKPDDIPDLRTAIELTALPIFKKSRR